MALIVSLCAGLSGAGHARAATATTITVDDSIQGTGRDQFDYQGSGWGHAGGEGAPANPHGGTNSWTDHTGDTVSFRFVGTQLTFRGVTGPGHGIGTVSLDGGAPTDVDFYSATRAGDVPLWTSPVLPDGSHTFTLTWTGRKNAASTGTPVTVDRADFLGEAPPPGQTDITVDAAGTGRTFDGIGAISGGGGNSRLLINYPEPQRSQILDYLFKPGYGASLQLLKAEIGGDTNSTDGAEPSIEHTRGVVDCGSGYEWWLMEQAKKRNPNIKLYGLAWGAPGWIGNMSNTTGGGDFWSQDMIDYLTTWLGCAKQHGLTIDYMGGWNERGYDKAWYGKLHATLAAKHLPVQVVGADSGLDVAEAMAADPQFAKSVDIVGTHYPCNGGDGGDATTCSSSATAQAVGKPLWASENGSQDDNTGTGALIRSITRGYLDGKFTAYLNWPLLAAIYPNLPYDTVGLAVANQPWSGAYSNGKSLWATAQVTQVTHPGWRFIDSASGYLGGDRSNGSYVTLKAPDDTAYSTIIETSTASSAQTANFTITGGLPSGTVHVWATDLTPDDTAASFVHTGDITPQGGHFSLTLEIHRGESATMKATFAAPASGGAVSGLTVRPGAPAGWTVNPTTPAVFPKVAPGRSVTASWTVTAPTAADTPVTASFAQLATYVRDGVPHWTRGTASTTVPIPPPTGSPYLSELTFASSTNGWGPVERDMSNGEQAAGDGHPITIRGTRYAKGLGVHAKSDVAFYLGGKCSRFTATVGIDDEVAPDGSVTFSVVADGKTLTTTPALTGASAARPLDVEVTGAEQLDLVVDDGGDGNAHDHADRADARLTCATG